MPTDWTVSSWHKSTHSGGGNDCVEVREGTRVTGFGGAETFAEVRDTKAPAAGSFTVPGPAWKAFLARVA